MENGSKLIVLADVIWMYDPIFNKYNRLFNIIPREVILHAIFSTEQIPDWEYDILDIGRAMYTTCEDRYTYEYTEFIDDLNDVIELFSTEFSDRMCPYIDLSLYEIAGWLDRYTVILVNSDRALECLRDDVDSYSKDWNNIFKKDKRIIEGLTYIFDIYIRGIMSDYDSGYYLYNR